MSASVKNLGVEVCERFFKWRWGGGGRVFSTLGGKRYCGDKDALSLKWFEVGGTRTDYEVWDLCVLDGGGGRKYIAGKGLERL